MALNKDLKVAILAIVSIIIMVLAYQFMRGTLMHNAEPVYSSYFTNVTSLKKSDKVFLNGVQVGVIKNIDFADIKDPNKIKVDFSINPNLQIPKNSVIEIISYSLMGNKGLKINMGNGAFAKAGDLFQGLNEKGMFDGITENMGPLADQSTIMMQNVNTLFDRKQRENLYVTIGELNKTLAALQTMVNSNQHAINGTLGNVEKLTHALAVKQNDIAQIISNTKEMTSQMKNADLSKSMNKMNQSMDELNKLMADINKGKGSLGKLMKDEELYNKLTSTSKSADELLKDMKENPKRYVHFSVFGGKK